MCDEEIVELYWSRDENAIRETERKYGAYCKKIAWNILCNHEDSEECANDTWLNAWNAMPPRRPSFLRAFLGKITRNLALHVYEKQRAEKRGGPEGQLPLALEELAECLPAPGAGERETAVVLTELLDRFLRESKPAERKIFVSRYWYFLSVKEIAKAYGMGESKVKMTLLRSRERLKGLLEEEGVAV